MDKEQIVHDLSMLCTNVQQLPINGKILVEETVKDYLENAKLIRKLLEENQD